MLSLLVSQAVKSDHVVAFAGILVTMGVPVLTGSSCSSATPHTLCVFTLAFI